MTNKFQNHGNLKLNTKKSFTQEQIAQFAIMATLTPEQAAAVYGFDEATLANWRYLKRGPEYIKLGDSRCSKILYRRKDIETWLSLNQVRTIDSRLRQ
jgi:hypothetical protein